MDRFIYNIIDNKTTFHILLLLLEKKTDSYKIIRVLRLIFFIF